MKLWLLTAREDVRNRFTDNPWRLQYGLYVGFVVRAETEAQARQLGHEETMPSEMAAAWLDGNYSNCVELTGEGESGIILADYQAE